MSAERGDRRPARGGSAPGATRPTPAHVVAIATGLSAFALAGLWLALTFPAGALDRAGLSAVAALRAPEADRLWLVATTFGDADFLVWPMLATVATLAVAGRRRLAADAAILFLATPLAVAALKVAVRRPRPPADLALPDAFAFPSGHATGGAVVLGALAVLCLVDRPDARAGARALVWGVAAAGALAIAVSRVWLGVHWPSDVIAALGLALALVAGFAARARADARAGAHGATPWLGPWLVAGYLGLWALHAHAGLDAAAGLYGVGPAGALGTGGPS